MPTTAPQITERDLQAYVRDLARTFGWMYFHTWISKHSAAGFPDVILLRGPRLVVAELKSEKGKTTEAQEEWLAAWRAFGQAEVHVWRPGDMEEIARVLR